MRAHVFLCTKYNNIRVCGYDLQHNIRVRIILLLLLLLSSYEALVLVEWRRRRVQKNAISLCQNSLSGGTAAVRFVFVDVFFFLFRSKWLYIHPAQ
jgi:hypothetical protein